MRVEDVEIKLNSGEVLKLKKYIAKDGKELDSDFKCIQYENILDAKEKIDHIPFKTSSIMGFDSWYYISSIDDFRALKNYIAVVIQNGTRTDFDVYDSKGRFVNEWISYAIEHQEDNEDYCSFISYKKIQKDFRKIQEDFFELEKALNKK